MLKMRGRKSRGMKLIVGGGLCTCFHTGMSPRGIPASVLCAISPSVHSFNKYGVQCIRVSVRPRVDVYHSVGPCARLHQVLLTMTAADSGNTS